MEKNISSINPVVTTQKIILRNESEIPKLKLGRNEGCKWITFITKIFIRRILNNWCRYLPEKQKEIYFIWRWYYTNLQVNHTIIMFSSKLIIYISTFTNYTSWNFEIPPKIFLSIHLSMIFWQKCKIVLTHFSNVQRNFSFISA